MSEPVPDVIDLLVGIEPGSHLDGIRAQRPQTRANAQASYLALFRPTPPVEMGMRERFAVAMFVAGLHRQQDISAFYAGGLGDAALTSLITSEIARGAARGPYGSYPAGPLSDEDEAGPLYRVFEEHRSILGQWLAAAFEHAHLLVFHPRDAEPAALQKLLDAGWSTTGIVTLSQLVAFLSFQIRVVIGLRSLAGAPADRAGH
jgi:CMD domain protein